MYLTGVVTALVLAVGLGRNRIARLLLERGADVHARARNGATALWVGAESGNVEMIVALAAVGGDVNAAAGGGATPIWRPSVRGEDSIHKRLPTLVSPMSRASPANLTIRTPAATLDRCA